MNVVITQCTGAKRDGQCRAKEMYMASPYFRKQRRFATTHGDAWYIQSAKHGLLSPDTIIEPYDKHATEIADPRQWADTIATSLQKDCPTNSVVTLLGGKAYTDPVKPVLIEHGYLVKTPLSGLGIGERMAALDNRTQRDLDTYA